MVLDGGQSMTKPLIVVNFKTYASASGATAETLAVAMEAHSNGPARMVAVVSAFDLEAVRRAAPSLEVWSQHLDPVGQGGFTGWLEPKTAMHRGAQGTIINHAEHKVEMDHVKRLLPQLPDDFPVCGCAADLEEAKSLAEMGPTLLGLGSRGMGLSSALLAGLGLGHEEKLALTLRKQALGFAAQTLGVQPYSLEA